MAQTFVTTWANTASTHLIYKIGPFGGCAFTTLSATLTCY
ncbi:hypothetical protein SynBIOSU31_02615 [Synechococcus sp. BIOS-U3-1]|nr:hypothetical protein SynBIOSU31_02615 [Synechococcus sp. BIOS-U3-1]